MKKNIKQTQCGEVSKPGKWYTFDCFCDDCGIQTRKFGKSFLLIVPEGKDYCDQCRDKLK